MFESFTEYEPLDTGVRAMLIIWCILLVPWFPVAMLAGLAFDGGRTWHAYVFVWSVWVYPVTLLIAFIFRRRVPSLSLLPILSVLGGFLFG